MKILFLVNHLAEFGGIEKMLNHKILALKQYLNYEIVLVTRYQNNRAYLFENLNFTKKYDLNITNTGVSFFCGLKVKIDYFKKVNVILKDEKPDVVITTLTSFYSLILPFIKPNTPKILEFHSTASIIKSGQWKFKRVFYKLYDAIVVLNEDEKNNYNLNNTVIIPNFVHEENIISYPEFRKKKNTIVAAGRIEAVKQFGHLILIWKQLAKKYPDWRVEIYGEGNEHDALEKLIIELNLSKSVKLMGSTQNLSNIMKESSIYCLTSISDCFPMVLLEAKQVGLPIISYDCPYGPKHIIKNNIDGILIEKDNRIAFSMALEKLIVDDAYREMMSINSYKNFKEFSSQKVINLWVDLFNKFKANNGK